MQPLLGTPRNASTSTIVTGLLQNYPSVQVTAGLRQIKGTSSLQQGVDLSAWLQPSGSSVSFDNNATINATATLVIASDAPFNPVTDYVQPYITLTNPDTGASGSFDLGVFLLQTPTRDESTVPALLTYTGYDLLYLLNQPVGDSYLVTAGTDPVTAAVSVISLALPGYAVNYTDTSARLAVDMSWVLGSSDVYSQGSNGITFLQIANDLLAAAGYFPAYVNWEGIIQLRPYVSPLNRASEWTFDMTASNNIVAEARTQQQDLFSVPNYFRFYIQNQTPSEGTTQYTYSDTSPASPGSTAYRPYLIRYVAGLTVVDYPSLVAAGNQTIALMLSPAETFAISTSPFPLAWWNDRVTLVDPNLQAVPPVLSPSRNAYVSSWSLPLDGSNMVWNLQTATL